MIDRGYGPAIALVGGTAAATTVLAVVSQWEWMAPLALAAMAMVIVELLKDS